MLLSRDVSLTLRPAAERCGDVPFRDLLAVLAGARFRRHECARILERCVETGRVAPGMLLPDAVRAGGAAAHAEFGANLRLDWEFAIQLGGEASSLRWSRMIAPNDVGAAARLLRTLLVETNRSAALDAAHSFGDEFARRMIRHEGAHVPEWAPARSGAVTRRDHASVVIRSRTTSILVDPIAYLGELLPNMSSAPALGERHDAVVVTHGHGDHWHIPSLLAAGSNDVPVIVPHVPATGPLSPVRFEQAVARVEQPVRALPWGSSVRVGDIEIDALPFYGEQPTRDAPGAIAGARNWGNCYRFNTPEYSVLLLVDSGSDPTGDMRSVVADSVRRKGPIDLVLSCLREFASPFFPGLARDWSVVPFEHLERLYDDFEAGVLPPTTAGPVAIAELCTLAKARAFLPYANGFEGVGRSIEDVGWGGGEPSEEELLRRVETELRARKASVRALRWVPGASATVGGAIDIV